MEARGEQCVSGEENVNEVIIPVREEGSGEVTSKAMEERVGEPVTLANEGDTENEETAGKLGSIDEGSNTTADDMLVSSPSEGGDGDSTVPLKDQVEKEDVTVMADRDLKKAGMSFAGLRCGREEGC